MANLFVICCSGSLPRMKVDVIHVSSTWMQSVYHVRAKMGLQA